MRMGERLRSVGIPLKELFNNPSGILDKLLECQSAAQSNFRVVFYNDSYDSEVIEKLFKAHADKIFKLNLAITKDLNESSFFHINYAPETTPMHRYGYVGDPISGLDAFLKLLAHINVRIQEGYR